MAERDEALFEHLRGAVVYGVIRNLMYPAHVHKGYEVLCMLEGELTVYTPMRTLRARPGHIVFIAENVIHGYVAQRGNRTLMLAYTPKGSEPFVWLEVRDEAGRFAASSAYFAEELQGRA